MSVRFHRAWLLLLFIVCLAFGRTSRTYAQLATESYSYWIDKALKASEAGNWEEAYAAFARANETKSSARALRGMGVSSYRMGRHAQALFYLQEAVRESEMALDDSLRTHVQGFVDVLNAQVGRCVFTVNASNHEITVDGTRSFLDDEGRVLVDAGLHSLTVSASGYQSKTMEISVIPGTVHYLEVELPRNIDKVSERQEFFAKPSVATEVTEPPIGTETSESTASGHRSKPRLTRSSLSGKPEHRSESRTRIVTWVAAATIPLFAMGTGLAWYFTQEEGDDIAEHCRKVGCSPEERDRAIRDSSLETLETLTNAGWVLVAAATITTGVAFVLEGEQSKRESRIVATPASVHYTVGF